MKKVSVLIVNWNGVDLLKDCLPTLKSQTYSNFELIVVDNGSQDGSQGYVRQIFPEALIIQLDRNYGFSKPNNIGFSKATGEYILTLNNDISLEHDFLAKIVGFMDSQSNEIYAVNPKVLYFYQRNVINTIGIKLLSNGGGVHIGKNSSSKSYNDIIDVFGVCAGCALYRKTTIVELGFFFDESYFAYLEDVDLSIRAYITGYKSKYFPGSVCYHKHSATAEKCPLFKIYLIERNRLRNLIKYYHVKYLLLEPIITFIILFSVVVKGNNESGLSIDQRKLLKDIWKLIETVGKARLSSLKDISRLIKQRKLCGKISHYDFR